MSFATQYYRINWKVINFSPELIKNRNSITKHFELNLGGEKQLWQISLATGRQRENLQDNDTDEENPNPYARVYLHRSSCDSPTIDEVFWIKFQCNLIDPDGLEQVQFVSEETFENKKFILVGDNLDMSHVFEIDPHEFEFLIEIQCRPKVKEPAPTQLEYLLNNSLYSDYEIVCRDRVIKAHRVILYVTSPVFARILEARASSSDQLSMELDVDGNVVFELMRFLYTGKVENIDEIAKDLMTIAEKYELPDLIKKCAVSLSMNLNVENVIEILFLAHQLEEKVLLHNCIKFMKWKQLKLPDDLQDIDSNLLKEIVNVLMEEGESSIHIGHTNFSIDNPPN